MVPVCVKGLPAMYNTRLVTVPACVRRCFDVPGLPACVTEVYTSLSKLLHCAEVLPAVRGC